MASGLGLGAEMLGAEAALDVGAPLAVVLAYPEPQAVWPAASRRRFEGLVDRAGQVVLLQKRAPASKQQAGAALARRDAWLARQADEAVLVWDRADDALGRLFRSFEDRLGEDVWVVDPTELCLHVHLASDTGGTFTDLVASTGASSRCRPRPTTRAAAVARRRRPRSRRRATAAARPTARPSPRTRCSSGGARRSRSSPTRASPT